MGTLWKIALRNTWRHRRRTTITAAVMTAGIGLFILFDSALTGMDGITVDNLATFTTSSVKIRTPAYVDDIAATPLDKGVPDAERALLGIAAAGYAATPRLRFVAKLSNYEDEIPVIADAVDPAADAKVFGIARSVIAGSWLSARARTGAAPGAGDGPGAKQAVIGAELAKELGLSPGDSLIVSAQTLGDATNADEFAIVGLVSCASPEVNRSGFYVSLPDARALLDAGPSLVTEIDVFLPKAPNIDAGIAKSAAVAALLRPALPALRIDHLGELAKDYLAMRNMKAKGSYMMILVVLIIAAVGIVNTILMSVYARVREIGVLRAYGMTRKDIARLFTLEGFAVGLIGSTFGVLLGIALDFLIIRFGVDVGSMLGGASMGSIPLSGMLYGAWNPKTMAVGFVFGIVVSLVSARIPARMAARLEPTDALRFV